MKINVRELNIETLIQFYFILRNNHFHQYADGIIKEIRRRDVNVHDAMDLVDTDTYSVIKEDDENNND